MVSLSMLLLLFAYSLKPVLADAGTNAGADANSAAAVHFLINDEEVTLEEPTYMEHDRLYVPLRFIVESLGAEVAWDHAAKQVTVKSRFGDQMSFTINDLMMKFNGKAYTMDVVPLMKKDKIYLPIRQAAELLHTEIEWNNETKSAHFHSVPSYIVEKGDTLTSVSKKFALTEEWLTERNGLKNGEMAAGQSLKVVIPNIMREKERNDEIYLLAKIICAESGYESFKGQVAVGNVIINRVKDSRFPNSIREVIYAPHQFTPAGDGSLDTLVPNESSILAALSVMDGEDVAKDALYFFNPKHDANTFFDKLDVVADIGNHRFAK